VTQPSDDAADAAPGSSLPTSPPAVAGPSVAPAQSGQPQGYGYTRPPVPGPGPGHVPPGYGAPGYGPPGYGPPGYAPVPVPLSPGGQPLAGFGERFAAYLIDVGILTLVFTVVTVPVVLIFVMTRMPDLMAGTDPYGYTPEPDFAEVWQEFLLPLLILEAVLFLLLLVGYYVYDVEMMFKSGQTLGKKLMKIRIVPLDPSRVLTRGDAAKRFAVEKVAGTFLPFFSYVDGFWQLWDKPYQQTLHDKVATTIVIKVPS
jgi:uncharacterized RDD family membrane protein YckC